jgi:hypothetical protein
MDFNLGEQNNSLLNYIQQVSLEKNVFQKLEYTDIIINALDDDIKKRVKAKEFQKYIHELYADDEFMRKLEYVSTVKENVESSLEYFGFDYASAPDFTYQKETEEKIKEIRKELSRFFGSLIKEMSKGVELEL